MNIAMIGDSDKGGGAAIAATRLSMQLSKNGNRVRRFVVRKRGDEETTWGCGNVTPIRKNILRVLWHAGLLESHDRLSDFFYSGKLAAEVRKYAHDVINVHNIHSAGLTVRLLALLDTGKGTPIVWTLHDMWVLTGHCAHSYDCAKFADVCDATCPYPDEYPPMRPDRILESFSTRKRVFRETRNLAFITPSQWLARQAEKGILSSFPIIPIPNGIDLGVFCPADRMRARSEFGFPEGKKILLMGAAQLKDKMKRIEYLLRALRELPEGDTFLLALFGSAPVESEFEKLPVEVRALGEIADEERLARLYAAADVFVHPTLADNLPNVLVESIACGTPCIAFDVGGVSEVVRPGTTGFLARERDPDELAKRILELFSLTPERRRELSLSCREVAERDYSLVLQAERYEKTFGELIERAPKTL